MKRFLFLSVLLLGAPVARAQWVPTSDFTVASATAFAGDDYALYGVSGGRLYEIDPASNSWSLIPSSPIDIYTVAKVGYSIIVTTANYNDMYLSVNSGGTWTQCKIGSTNLLANWVVASGGTVYAGTVVEGVYVSTDSGSTWSASNSGLSDLDINCLFATGKTVLAGTTNGVFISSNSGTSWIGTAALPDRFISRVATDGTVIYAGNDEGVNGGLFYSLDNGGSWQRADAGLPNKNIHALATTSRGVFAGTDSGLYFSRDRGANWSEIKSGMEGAWIFAINQLGLFGDYIFVGTSGGAFVSTDNGNSWASSSIGASVGVSSVGDIIVNGKMLIAASGFGYSDPTSGVFQSSNGGQTWIGTSTGLPNNRAITSVAAEDSFLFAGSDSGVFVSTNQGLSWSPSDSGFYNFLPVTALATIGSNVFAVTGNFHVDYSVLRSTNNGVWWRDNGPPVVNDIIDFIASVGTKVYVGAEEPPTAPLYMSTDSGASWKSIGLPTAGYRACTAMGSKLFFAAFEVTGLAILSTSDDGVSWTTADTGLSMYQTAAIVSYGSALILGNGEGIFVSKDEGVHWAKANEGLFDSTVQTLAIQGSILFAGTLGGGIFKRSIPEMLGSLDVALPAKSETSIQSYPNPFTHSTTLEFTSPESGYATVTIVNQLGVEIARLFSGELGTGEHSFQWNVPDGIPAGMYECSVRMNGTLKEVPVVVQK